MLYLHSFLCPPLAILLCGKPFQAIFSILFCLLYWIPGVIWALIVVSNHKATSRKGKNTIIINSY